MASLGSVRADVASRLPSDSTVMLPDLNTWINEGAREIARRAEVLETLDAIAWPANQQQAVLPINVARVHRVEFVDASGLDTYVVQTVSLQELDQVWGVLHTSQATYPSYAYMYGFTPNLTINIFPVPAQNGTLNVYYFRFPAAMVNDADLLECPNGWEDLVSLYVESLCQRKDRDQIWSTTRQLFETQLENMIDKTRNWHDQAGMITVGVRQVPSWLYDFE